MLVAGASNSKIIFDYLKAFVVNAYVLITIYICCVVSVLLGNPKLGDNYIENGFQKK